MRRTWEQHTSQLECVEGLGGEQGMFLWVYLCVYVCVHWSPPLLGKQGAIPKGPASRLTQFPSLACLYCLSSPTVLLGSGGRHRLWGQPACHPPFPALVITWGGLGGGVSSKQAETSKPSKGTC